MPLSLMFWRNGLGRARRFLVVSMENDQARLTQDLVHAAMSEHALLREDQPPQKLSTQGDPTPPSSGRSADDRGSRPRSPAVKLGSEHVPSPRSVCTKV